MAFFRWTSLAWILAVLTPLSAAAQPEVTSAQVRASINRAVVYLKSKQNKVKGNWADHVGQPGGVTALCTLALLEAGVPPTDPAIKKALAHLRTHDRPRDTYAASLQTMALVAADPTPRNKDLALIRRNAAFLQSIQITTGEEHNKGTWSYGADSKHGHGDNSNTQFALLALHEAERVGVEVRDDVWRLGLRHWLLTQNPSGGWGYHKGQAPTGSMTCAGIASVVICSGQLANNEAKIVGDGIHCCGGDEATEADKALQLAQGWMSRNFSSSGNPSGNEAVRRAWYLYYMYGVERVGRMTGRRFFGEGDTRKDWYRKGIASLLTGRNKRQDALTGAFTGEGQVEGEPVIGTSLALLFLSKGLRPVMVGRLQHGTGDDWSRHRGGINRLTRHVETKWGKNLTWQTIDGRIATTEDLLQTPVLFISGSDALSFGEREKENLKAYVNSGGFIFAEAACGGAAFERSFKSLMEELFPGSPLKLLPPDHPIWFTEVPVDPGDTPLYGLNTCCRTSVVFCPKDLSCYWELGHPRTLKDKRVSDVAKKEIDRRLAIGANVMAYATGRELRDKLDVPEVAGGEDTGPTLQRNVLHVAKIRHAGGSDDAPSALANLVAVGREEIGLRVVTEIEPVAATDEALFSYPILFMHGRRAFRFSDAERQRLREYLERGGFIFADSICANEQFAEAFRREMAQILKGSRLTDIPDDHVMYTQEYRGFDVRKITLRDPTFRADGDPLKAKLVRTSPRLQGIELDGRLVVVFSPYDISCALENSPSLECKGYVRQDAARLGVNVVMYALQQ